MTETFYLDTSIWLDYYEKRGRNGELALKLILYLIESDLVIVYSDLVIKELRQQGNSSEQINHIFSVAKPDNLRRVHVYRVQIDEAKKLARVKNVPVGDALHAILARDNELRFITRDHDFDKLKDITKSKLPEDFI